MRFTTAVISTMATVATAAVLPRADYGGWNVTFASTGGSNRQRTETVTADYANAQLADNIKSTCHFRSFLNGEDVNLKTCDPDTFSYELALKDFGNGFAYSKERQGNCDELFANYDSDHIDSDS